MRVEFNSGDFVYYFNPQHHFHMMMFQIVKIVPASMGTYSGYELAHGARSVFATYGELMHRQDPKVKQLQMDPSMVAAGPHLDIIGENFSIRRAYGEDDASLRTRLREAMRSMTRQTSFQTVEVPKPKNHDGHEVIENHAGGKTFKYCRKCKVEVYE